MLQGVTQDVTEKKCPGGLKEQQGVRKGGSLLGGVDTALVCSTRHLFVDVCQRVLQKMRHNNLYNV